MNHRINKRQETRERHKGMVCKSYLLKIDRSHLSKRILEQLNLLFLEAKWFINHAIANGVFDTDYKTTTVQVKVGDEYEDRVITILSSQMRQSLIDKLKADIRNLSVKKANGYKVGKLKFKGFVRSIPLKQYGVTYDICGKNHIRIQKISRKLRVRGLKQIPDGVEYANAFLIQDHGDYYLRVVTYQEPETVGTPCNASIGIDFGMKNQMTFSNGVSVQYRIPLTERLRKLYQKLSRTERNSKNRYKIRLKLQKEFYRINSKKADMKNKIVSYLRRHYDTVCYQDDDMHIWQRVWGRKVLDTAIGGIKGILDERIPTPVAVPPEVPTTQRCHSCGSIESIPLGQYQFVCSSCGNSIHRDVNAAINIEKEGLNQLPVERREAALNNQGRQACGEGASTLAMLEYLNRIPHVRARLLCEAGSLTALA